MAATQERRRIVSGMRPTGRLHVGHYWGALKNWVDLQDEFDCHYFVADLHVLTDHHDKLDVVAGFAREMIADWIACGLDPERSVFFVQSVIPEHLELAWYLGSVSPVGILQRCPTYKDEAQKLAEKRSKETPMYGLLGYPVLQASDIALYKGEFVPVGEDQVSHLEICREIVRKFNRFYGQVLPEPQPKLTDIPRIRGTDGEAKMSKSLGNVLELGEEPDALRKLIKGMFTDPQRRRKTDPGRPEICNVFTFHRILGNPALETVAAECTTAKRGCVDCKMEMADHLLKFLEPIRGKRTELLSNPARLDEIIHEGNERARKEARATMAEVRRAMYG
ncbi:MAG: tryptophan--tRNA ligase [Planctomycetota bacterium]|jgi:tryptophanyl-tRNA synthetase